MHHVEFFVPGGHSNIAVCFPEAAHIAHLTVQYGQCSTAHSNWI